MNDLEAFYGPNAGYVLELYDRYRQNPASVDSATRAIFDTWSPDSLAAGGAVTQKTPYAGFQIFAPSAPLHAKNPQGSTFAAPLTLGSEPPGAPSLFYPPPSTTHDRLAQHP